MSTMTTTNPVEALVEASNISPSRAVAIRDAFKPLWEQACAEIAKSAQITVTAADQLTEMRAAKTAAGTLKDIRVAADHLRVEYKADALREGKAIQDVFNNIAALIEPEEERLKECVKFAERAEAKRKEELRASRVMLLAPYLSDLTGYDLGGMPAGTFDTLLTNARDAHEARVEKSRKEEEARKAAELARIEDERRVRAENERLRLENAEKDRLAAAETARREKADQEQAERIERDRKAMQAQADAERKKVEDDARAEREQVAALQREKDAAAQRERDAIQAKADEERRAREQAEAKIREQRAAEERRKKADAAAKAKAARAPDKDKILAIASVLRDIPNPDLKSEEALVAMDRVTAVLHRAAFEIEQLASQL